MTYLDIIRKHYDRAPERNFYPGGQPYYTSKCPNCGDYFDFDSEQDALAFFDDHAKCEDDDDDE